MVVAPTRKIVTAASGDRAGRFVESARQERGDADPARAGDQGVRWQPRRGWGDQGSDSAGSGEGIALHVIHDQGDVVQTPLALDLVVGLVALPVDSLEQVAQLSALPHVCSPVFGSVHVGWGALLLA